MSESARSVFVFAIYLLIVGPALLLAPNFLLGLLNIPATQEVWIHVIGMLASILGYYYLRAALAESKTFIEASVHGRLAVLGFFLAFVALGIGPAPLIVFGVIDAAGAVWTATCLRTERFRNPSSQD